MPNMTSLHEILGCEQKIPGYPFNAPDQKDRMPTPKTEHPTRMAGLTCTLVGHDWQEFEHPAYVGNGDYLIGRCACCGTPLYG